MLNSTLYLIFLLSQLPNQRNEYDINTSQLAILVNDPADKSSLTAMFWLVDEQTRGRCVTFHSD